MPAEYLSQWQIDYAKHKANRGVELSETETLALTGAGVNISYGKTAGQGVIVFPKDKTHG